MSPIARVEIKDVYVDGVNSMARALGVKQWIFMRKQAQEEVIIPILRGVSTTFYHGERIGIIGRNGSGKSSLLKAIAGIYPPKSGSINVNGKVAPVIEMGLGFESDFTGRQNIKLGMLYSNRLHEYSEALEQQIIEFSELGEKIDVPLRYYSSGMQARLSFSVTVFQHPEILLLDEVFAAGDSGFVKKSEKLMLEKFHAASLAVLVSHGDQFIQDFCTRCIWMEQGKIIADGDPKEVVAAYREGKMPHAL